MNPRRLFIPYMMMNPIMKSNYITPRNIGIIERVSNSFRSIGWGKILSGTSKTLNVLNQTIPLIKQTKPMINNAKNMINLLKAFKKETTIDNYQKIVEDNIVNNNAKKKQNNQYPTFFV